MNAVFAGFPEAYLYDKPVKKGKKKVEHFIWGDTLEVLGPKRNGFVKVRARGATGWVVEKQTQPNQLLDIIFLDVGQGDSALIVTPDDRRILLDAGQTDNLKRYLKWRYKKFPQWNFAAAVISHSDSDHYRGLAPILSEKAVKNALRIDTLYHNGIMDRAAKPKLGPETKIGKQTYLTELPADHPSFVHLAAGQAKKSQYVSLLDQAVQAGVVKQVRMISATDKFLPGFDQQACCAIRVLAPVSEKKNGRTVLRKFPGADGRTKNGHSVVLMIEYGQVKILLGGDLNTDAEDFLLTHYTKMDKPTTVKQLQARVKKAREVFQADAMKAWHHGSSDFTDEFLEAVNPVATVISSGDDESYAHPRADTLGTLGLHSRGPRPLVLSTELARSTKELVKKVSQTTKQFESLWKQVAASADPKAMTKALAKVKAETMKYIKRTTAVYGAINLRTDGDKIIFAQKLERPAGGKVWDIYQLKRTDGGPLQFVKSSKG
jgi:beta-lactamase superfamily II metal-dependent hydrolase